MNESCYQGDDSVLKSLVEIADTAPKYLRPNLEATLQLCLKVGQRAPACQTSLLLVLKHTDETQSSANISTETCRKQIRLADVFIVIS